MRLYGKTIVLRELKYEDLSSMHSWVNDPEVTKNLELSIFPRTLDDSKRFLEMQLCKQDNKSIYYAISLIDDEAYIGTVGLKNIDYINRNCELAITIGSKQHMGKGYGKEAVELITDYAFDTLNMNKIYLNFLSRNLAAENTYAKCGYKRSGIFRNHIYKEGGFHDLVFMEIMKDEFYERRA